MQPAAHEPAAGRSTGRPALPGGDAAGLLRLLITKTFRDRICLASSFGSEAAVLLHMVAEIDPATPVVFTNTGKLFGETLAYRDRLVGELGLLDVREARPLPADLVGEDTQGHLWMSAPERCCYLRKVAPFNRAIAGFDAVITGRKSHHGAARVELESLEASADGKIRVNPLLHWRDHDLEAYFARHDLPPHPLVADGFRSVGCMPCTDRVLSGEAVRAGRWRGQGKTECGIHLELPPGHAKK